jgi:hypothetical protein
MEAKHYLVDKIVSKAEWEGIPLSEIERKMLYFSDADWALPEVQKVRTEFNHNHDLEEFQQKIAGLVHKIQTGVDAHQGLEKVAWDQAVEVLQGGGHFLHTLIHFTPEYKEEPTPSPGRRSKRRLIASVCVFVGIAFLAFVVWFFRTEWSQLWR